MKIRPTFACLICLGALSLRAQYVPPSPTAPVPGIIDDDLRAADPSWQNWDIGVNERIRAEDKLGAGSTHAGSGYDFAARPPSANNNSYWDSRLMPRVGYTSDWFGVMVEARSSYSIGDNRYNATAAGLGLTDNDGPLQAQQAYLSIGNLKEFPLLLKAGRQELLYGDQRLIGPSLWVNVPRTFDAVKLRYQDAFMGVDLFAANVVYDHAHQFNRSNSQDTLSGAYFDFPGLVKTNIVEAYVLNRDVARGIVTDDWSHVPASLRFPAPQDLYTFGFHTKTKPGALGPWDYGVEAMAQSGKRTPVLASSTVAFAKAAPRLDQSAWAFVVQGGYTWRDCAWKPRLAAIVSCASGDKNPSDANSGTFQNIMPSNHGLYGVMDLTALENIEDYRLSFTVKPTKATSLAFDLHQQYLETTRDYWYKSADAPRVTSGAAAGSGRGFGINPTYNPNLGQEADLLGGWTVRQGLLLEAGFGHFFRGEYIKQSFSAVGSKDAEYGYLQMTINL